MTKSQRLSLSEAIRDCIASCRAQGYFTSHSVTEMVLERHADLIEEITPRAVGDFVTKEVRRVMKCSAPRDGYQLRLALPADIAHLQIGEAISLPPEGRDATDDIDREDFLWVGTYEATFEELQIHIRFLEHCISRDQGRLEQVQSLRDFLAPYMVHQPDEPIGPVLEAITNEQQAKAA